MNKILIGICAVVVIALLGLGWFGLVPGLSDLLGANRPRDLGIRYTQADLDSIHQKNGVIDVVLPATATPAGSLRYEGSKPLTNSFTSSELTARAQEGENYQYNPISNQQIRINPDGTAEVSGNMNLDRIDDVAAALNIPASETAELKGYMDKFRIVNKNPAFYAKGTLSIVNNNIDMDIEKAEI